MTVNQRVVKSSVHGRLKNMSYECCKIRQLVHDKVADNER